MLSLLDNIVIFFFIIIASPPCFRHCHCVNHRRRNKTLQTIQRQEMRSITSTLFCIIAAGLINFSRGDFAHILILVKTCWAMLCVNIFICFPAAYIYIYIYTVTRSCKSTQICVLPYTHRYTICFRINPRQNRHMQYTHAIRTCSAVRSCRS